MKFKGRCCLLAFTIVLAAGGLRADEREQQIQSLKKEVSRLHELLKEAQGTVNRLAERIADIEAEEKPAARPTDEQVAKDLVQRLQALKNSGLIQGFDIAVHIEDGVATLKGRLRDTEQLSLILKVARKAKGVRRVRNELTIIDPSAVRQQRQPWRVNYSSHRSASPRPSKAVDEGMLFDALERQYRRGVIPRRR